MLSDAAKCFAFCELIDVAHGIDFEIERPCECRMLPAHALRVFVVALAAILVEPVGNKPRTRLRSAQLALQIIQIAIADAAQKASNGNAARSRLLRDLIGRLKAEPIEIRQHIGGNALGCRRERGKALLDRIGKRSAHRGLFVIYLS